jgi:signal peptidase II
VKKTDWPLILSLIFIVWFSDYVTKAWAVYNLSGFPVRFWGPFGLVLHRNPGAMLGTFSNLPPILRIVTLSTGGAFLIFIYSSIQYLLPKRSIILRCGMSILLGGILGNVTDRIISGSVVDFLLIRTPFWVSPAFNVADVLQWVGYLMIVYTLIVHGEQIWPSQDTRKRVWVIPKFQIKYIFVLISVGLGFAIISGVFAFTFLKITIDELALSQALVMEKKFLVPFLLTYSSISFTFLIALFLIGRIVSHRTAGPIYAFELYINDLILGKDRRFKVRAGDELSHLEDVAEKLRENEEDAFEDLNDLDVWGTDILNLSTLDSGLESDIAHFVEEQ